MYFNVINLQYFSLITTFTDTYQTPVINHENN